MADHGVTMGAIAGSLGTEASVRHPETYITSVTHDSRNVEPGSLFVAVTGDLSDGHTFVPSALEAGASGVLVQYPVEDHVPQIVVPDSRAAMAWAARTVYGKPDQALEIVGITGTNGKTTVAHLCESIWRAAGRIPGLVGTLGARIAGTPIAVERTTPEASDLQELLATMRDAGVEVVAMEVSSHAMKLHRADAIRFAVVAFTNLSQDHLDFHGSMASYFEAKAALFDSKRARRSVISIDDHYGRRLLDISDVPGLTVGSDPAADVQIVDVDGFPGGTRFGLEYGGERMDFSIPLIGAFNVSNAAVAATIAISMDTAVDAITEGLADLTIIPGRMELIDHTGPFRVVVDYAHTPNAISEVLQAAREAATGRVIAVVGAAGDRDKDKRALMGAAAVRFADLTVVTSDNPRSEDPATIAGEVRRGADAVPGANAYTVLDRGAAIRDALSSAKDGDIVLILGKGHEQGIEAHGVITPFDDRLEARAALEALGLRAP